ncbi:MAG: hypothetical protein KDD82_14405 [Planctomycetes bacterium]|nr:hypothetical protein [Planctomycetota bacterium]
MNRFDPSSEEPFPLLWIRYRCPRCLAGHAVVVGEAGTVRRCRRCKRAVRIPTPRPEELRNPRRVTRAG